MSHSTLPRSHAGSRAKVIAAGVALSAALTTATLIAPATATACQPATVPFVRYDPTPAAADAV